MPLLAAGFLPSILCIALQVYWFILLAWVILSWAILFGLRPPATGPFRVIVDLLDDLTRPVIRPLQRMIPPLRAGGVGLDLSVLLAFVILTVLQQALC